MIYLSFPSILLILNFLNYLLLLTNSKKVANNIEYIAPRYPISNPNLTSGSIFVLENAKDKQLLMTPDVLHLLGNVCAMKGYSEGRLQRLFNFNLKANFNLEAFSVDNGKISLGIGVDYMTLLETNLKFMGSNQTVAPEFLAKVGAIFGNSITYDYYEYIPFFVGVKIPTIGYGISTFSRLSFVYNVVSFKFDRTSVYEIGATTGPSLLAAGLQVLRALNWSMVSLIFSRDDFGFYGQEILQAAQSLDNNLSVPCPASVPNNISSAESQRILQTFSTCLKNVYEVTAVVLWMNYLTAYQTIKWFRENNQEHLNFFIIYIDSEVFIENLADKSVLENVLFLRSYPNLATSTILNDCQDELDQDIYPKKLAKFVIECMEKGTGDFPDCNLNNPEENCVCTDEISKYYKQNLDFFAYAFDAVSVMARAISLLQNNCTYLNEYNARNPLQFNGENVFGFDFCALTEFTPFVLSRAIQAVNFTGLTGRIDFPVNKSTRDRSNLALFQLDSNLKAIEVGVYINGTLKFNQSRLTFPNNEAPRSAIVPQIPDLTYWFVDVFFGITCFILVIDVTFYVIITIFRNDRCMKISSPLFMALTTFGLFQVLVSNILLSIGLSSSAMCILTNFFLLSGLTFIVSSVLAKNYRVYRIFTNPSATAIRIKDGSLVQITIILVLFTWIMWAITSFASGPIKIVYSTGQDNLFYTYGLCEAPSEWFQTFQIIFWYVYFVTLFLVAGFLGFLTRNVRDVFNESANVTTTAFCYLTYAIIFAPLYYSQINTTNSNETRWVIQALSVCFLSAVTLILLICPAIWRFYRLKLRGQQQ